MFVAYELEFAVAEVDFGRCRRCNLKAKVDVVEKVECISAVS